jgi:predicted O-methyltransferase YrrM
MDPQLISLLKEIERFATTHDSKVKNHLEQLLCVTPETGSFLNIVTRAVKGKHVLEIGTSIGYSTLWIADALCYSEGIVTTIEISENKAQLARKNFERSGLSKFIEMHLEDAREYLKKLEPSFFDLVFWDAERSQYVSYWGEVDRVLKTGSILIVDNATSHPHELVRLIELVEASNRYLSQTLPIGKGEFIALKID